MSKIAESIVTVVALLLNSSSNNSNGKDTMESRLNRDSLTNVSLPFRNSFLGRDLENIN